MMIGWPHKLAGLVLFDRLIGCFFGWLGFGNGFAYHSAPGLLRHQEYGVLRCRTHLMANPAASAEIGIDAGLALLGDNRSGFRTAFDTHRAKASLIGQTKTVENQCQLVPRGNNWFRLGFRFCNGRSGRLFTSAPQQGAEHVATTDPTFTHGADGGGVFGIRSRLSKSASGAWHCRQFCRDGCEVLIACSRAGPWQLMQF